MSTRSLIGMALPGGKEAKVIYCHWDGYPDYNGRILLEHYNDPRKIECLISHGNLSVLGERINSDKSKEHSFDSPQENVCVFYARDRGESSQEAQICDINEAWEPDGWQEWEYLFKDKRWWYREKPSVRWNLLENYFVGR